MSMYNDIPVGLRVPSNMPLDAKLWVKSSSELESLGASNNLAYTYYKGMRIYCADEKEIYEWMPVSEGNSLSLTSLLDNDFTYPSGYNVNGVNYSNVAYNLFLVPQAWDVVIPNPPGLINVGSGADVYKGLNAGNHEIRGITADVVQPPLDNNQMIGNITANASVQGDNVQIQFDFSELRVPLQQVGIPEYYVHSSGDDTTADGSIVRPYKTWEACKLAIIGTGSANGYPVSFWNPQFSARVIFLSNITSSESLTLNRTTFEFRGDVTFTYTGSADAVIDMLAIINAVPTNGDGTKALNGYINISGEGTITRNMNAVTPYTVLRAAGFGGASIVAQNNFVVRFTSGKIKLVEKKTDRDTYFTESIWTSAGGGTNQPLVDGANRPVWVLNKSGGNDVIPATNGIITTTGRNYPVRECLYIDEGCQVEIKVTIQRAIYLVNESGLVNYGSIVLNSDSTSTGHTGVRYDINQDNGEINQYTPSSTVSLITVDNSYFNTSSNGALNAYLLGSTNQGGYNGFVELKGENPQFHLTSANSLLINTRMRYNYLLFLADNSTTGTKRFSVENIYTRMLPYEAIIGGSSGVTGLNATVNINTGSLESINDYVTGNNGKAVFGNDTLKSNINIGTSLLNMSTFLMKSVNAIPGLADNAAAIAYGLLPGMFYRTNDGTSSILKIVH